MTIAKAAGLVLTLIAAMTLGAMPAFAHRFNVTLVIAPSPETKEIRDGFMLATTERDSHPDEESDGHLGGLDVYVTVIEASADMTDAIGGQPDIVAIFGTDAQRTRLAGLAEGAGAVMLPPGTSPFAGPETAAVAAFKAAYAAAYGTRPTSRAADGYNTARRIARAVRGQGGVDDAGALRQSFSATARDFTW